MLEHWILALGASPWVYPALYSFATIDGFFPPVPSESVVIALAALAGSGGGPSPYLIVPVAALGAFTGDQIAYQIGTRVDLRRLRLFRGAKGQRALDWAEHALSRRGSSFIIAARYIPVGRIAVNMTAGSLRFPRRRFMGLTAFAGLTWAVYGTAIGIGAGAWFAGHPVVAVLVGIVIGTLAGVVIDWVLRRFLPGGAGPVVLGSASRAPVAQEATGDVPVAGTVLNANDPPPPPALRPKEAR